MLNACNIADEYGECEQPAAMAAGCPMGSGLIYFLPYSGPKFSQAR